MRRFILPIFLLAMLACRSESPDSGPKIFGALYVRYLQEGSLLKAQASFYEGDSAHTAAPKSIPGGVTFQGGGMEKRLIQDKMIRYQYEGEAFLPQQFRFQVQDDDGGAHSFMLDMAPIAFFSISDTVSAKAGFAIELEPAFRKADESLVLLFTGEDGNASLIDIPAPVEKNIFLDPARVSRLSPGVQQLYLVKKQKTTLTQGAYHITGEVEFYSNLREVFVKAE